MGSLAYKNVAYDKKNSKTLSDFQENIEDESPKKQIEELIEEIHEYIANEHPELIDEIMAGKKDKSVLEKVLDDFVAKSNKGQGLTQKNIVKKLADEIVGWERLQPLIDDDEITNIFTNEDLEVVKRVRGEDVLTNIRFDSDDELETFIKNIAVRTGEKINRDKCLMDGFDKINNIRIQAGIYGSPVRKGEVVLKPYIVLRKYPASNFKEEDFIENGTFSKEIADTYREIVEDSTIVIVGEPDAGKSTHLDYIQSLKDAMRRTIKIEEEAELKFKNKNSVSFEVRKTSGEEKRTKYDMAEFAKTATRLAGKDVIIGEVRDQSAWYLFRLIDMGYRAMYSIHGGNCRAGLEQTEFLMSLSNPNMTYAQIMAKICESVDFVVYMSQRKVIDIAEVVGFDKEQEAPKLNYIYQLKVGEDGEFYWKKGEISKEFREKLELRKKLKKRRT